jgi:hypothetical protein
MNRERKCLMTRQVTATLTAGAALALCLVPAAWSHPSSGVKKVPILRIRATIYGHPLGSLESPGEVVFKPSIVNVGTVIIIVKNANDEPSHLEIAGVLSRRIGSGGRAIMRVKFKRPGSYDATVPDDTTTGIIGVLKVVK